MKFPLNQISEFFSPYEGIFSIWGDVGVGKTTFSLQCAHLNSTDGKVLYLYTKPTLPTLKIKNIISNAFDHLIFIKCTKYETLYSLIQNLEFELLSMNDKKYKLIIIDSITDLYRLELSLDKKEKNLILNYQLNHTLASLSFLKQKYGIEVLITNEISRRKEELEFIEFESGGKVMEFWVKNSIKIQRTDKLSERGFKLLNKIKNLELELNSTITESGFI